MLRFRTPVIDLFASPSNAQLPRFISHYLCPLAEDHNALRCHCPPDLLYAFPPIPLIPRVVWKMIILKAKLLLVAPNWPRCPWFADW